MDDITHQLEDQVRFAVVDVLGASLIHPEAEQIRAMLEAGDHLTVQQLAQEQYATLPQALMIALVRLATLVGLAEDLGLDVVQTRVAAIRNEVDL